ncbi:MAG: DUF2461 domain-containing protein [Mariprofundus sp.]|nr:DUF2461 domain-containing protein [Mariprofundus sp.]
MHYFTPNTMLYLEALAANNSREWFQEHKDAYETNVREPALSLIAAVGEKLPEIAPHFRADSRKVGGSLMRAHRDTRFGRDKTPYKTNIGIQFRHVAGNDVHAPGLYLHISTTDVFIGAGTWHPPSDSLLAIRNLIVQQPAQWQAVLDDPAFARWFELSGDTLKRPPRGFDADHPLLLDIKRKDFIAMSHIAPALIEQDDFTEIVCDYFRAATPLMRFLCRALRVPY